MAVFLIIFVVAVISATVRPGVRALPVHEVLHPVSLVLAAIFPLIGSEAIHRIIGPLPAVLVPISPLIGANTVAPSLFIIAYIARAVRPMRLTLAMLNVIEPDSLIDSPIRAVEHPVSV